MPVLGLPEKRDKERRDAFCPLSSGGKPWEVVVPKTHLTFHINLLPPIESRAAWLFIGLRSSSHAACSPWVEESRGIPHLPASCPWPGTSGSDSTGSGCAGACRWDNLCYPDRCRWDLSWSSFWRSLCNLHSCTHRSASLVTREQPIDCSCIYSEFLHRKEAHDHTPPKELVIAPKNK